MNAARLIERALLASRWLLAPIYAGLGLLVIVLAVQFFRELVDIALRLGHARDADVIAATLTLIDLSLVAGLTVMVMLSGYENYISRLTVVETEKTVAWLGKLDSGSLKLKVAAALVVISAIRLLQGFMNIDAVPDDKLLWMTIIHLALVASAVAMTVAERIGSPDRPPP
jgi:uncharacterized protein (TIGR00645 family)